MVTDKVLRERFFELFEETDFPTIGKVSIPFSIVSDKKKSGAYIIKYTPRTKTLSMTNVVYFYITNQSKLPTAVGLKKANARIKKLIESLMNIEIEEVTPVPNQNLI